MIAEPRIEDARRLIDELAPLAGGLPAGARVAEVLAGLEGLARDAERCREAHARIEELVDALSALARLDFTSRPALRDDDSPMDAAIGSVRMLSEELSAYVEQHARIEQELECRVRQRTDELQRTNEALQREVAERTRAEDALRAREAQLVQASKMAAVGQLAAGVAHEINNPLAVILGFAQGLERRLAPEDERLRLPVSSIVREALRCRNLVRELLTFSRTGKKVKEPLRLGDVVRSAIPLLESRARTQETRVELDAAGEVPMVEGNRTQLEQVLINLGNNALDALGRGGHLTIRLARRDAQVALEVEDDGPGIPEEIRGSIFEPFFTTKDVGKGTGLGLSLSYEIVEQHGGSIEVRSAVGRGTTMVVRLPALAP